MKLKLLIAFMALSLVSCSDDDNSATGERQLEKHVFKKFANNGTLVDFYYITYDNNKMTGVYPIAASGAIFDKSEFFYNDNGYLSQVKGYKINETSPYITINLGYDSEGRIKTKEEVLKQFGETLVSSGTYTYNSDTTITYSEERDGEVIQTINYYKNASGQINKIDYGTVIYEATYSGENVSSFTFNGQTTYYTFDDTNTPVGPFLNSRINQLGTVENAILYGGFQSITLGVTKYVVGQATTAGNIDQSYSYEFDDEGYPIKFMSIDLDDNQPSYESEIIYQ